MQHRRRFSKRKLSYPFCATVTFTTCTAKNIVGSWCLPTCINAKQLHSSTATLGKAWNLWTGDHEKTYHRLRVFVRPLDFSNKKASKQLTQCGKIMPIFREALLEAMRKDNSHGWPFESCTSCKKEVHNMHLEE